MPNLETMTPEAMKKLAEQMQQKEYEGLSPEEAAEKKQQKERRKQENISILNETLQICQHGYYERDGIRVPLGRSKSELSEIRVFLPEEIKTVSCGKANVSCEFRCENRDALSMSRERCSGNQRVLVLNLASASRPGGAVHEGADGQEEALCRRSSLLLSLESEEAKRVYTYNAALHTHLGSDAVMISPNVVVFRDEDGTMLPQPFEIAVMSCSAPMIRLGLEGKTDEEYRGLLYRRIHGMLRCASSLGYQNLILGAFGCGVFGNDAAVVSDTFRRAFSDLPCFAQVDFAVLCTAGKEYNYQEFSRNFGRQSEESISEERQ